MTLFGEDGFSEDEKTIKEQQALKKKLMDTFGSEERTEQWDDTSFSVDENDHYSDIVELPYSDIDEAPINFQVVKFGTKRITYDERSLPNESHMTKDNMQKN